MTKQTTMHVWESEDDFDTSATELDSVDSSCCSFPTKELFSSEPLYVPFSKEFLSDFLYTDHSLPAHSAQEDVGAQQEAVNQAAVVRFFENSHRSAEFDNEFEESSNRNSSDLGNYWLYHHQEQQIAWKEEYEKDACTPIRINKRYLKGFQIIL